MRFFPSLLDQGVNVKAADLIRARFVIDFREQEFVVEGDGTRLNVYRVDDQLPVGVLRFGSSSSGAIWSLGDWIGEYAVDDSGHYMVVPIQKGFKSPEGRRRVDPLIHLLKSLSSAELPPVWSASERSGLLP